MLKQKTSCITAKIAVPAAFRRLCVETTLGVRYKSQKPYPAAFRRLCVETNQSDYPRHRSKIQPPLGGCVLKPLDIQRGEKRWDQPPLGGCVLKLVIGHVLLMPQVPAAFRRLCVETILATLLSTFGDPAAFRRLCVETSRNIGSSGIAPPAAFRRLCVETFHWQRLGKFPRGQPPLGGCVLKLC